MSQHVSSTEKSGKGKRLLKSFLMSLLATTVSIALTFGVAAILDNNKKKKEKHEIVMMVMYDMYNSLKSVQTADSLIRHSMQLQCQLAEDTTQLKTIKYQFILSLPMVEYTETTERIFSSSIETINTVGSVLFTQNVAEFYQVRKAYKTVVCDSVADEMAHMFPSITAKEALEFRYLDEALLSIAFTWRMKCIFEQCKQLMKVSDEEIEAYQTSRVQMEESMPDYQAQKDSIMNQVTQLQRRIDQPSIQ